MSLFPVDGPEPVALFEGDLEPDPVSESQARASRDGHEFDLEAFAFLERAGARILDRYIRVDGYRLDALVEGTSGARYYVDAHGSPDRTSRRQAGMRRQDTVLKFGYKALYLATQGQGQPLLLITSHMPGVKLSAARILRDLADAGALWDAVATSGDWAGFRRLERYFGDGPPLERPLPAPWRESVTQLSLDDGDALDDAEEF